MTTHHTSGAADLPVITRKDRQFLHDNPNTDDLVAWVQDYAARAVALAAGRAVTPADGWLQDGGLLYRLTDERRPCNRDEIRVTMANGSRSTESCSRRASELLDRIRLTPPAMDSGDAARLDNCTDPYNCKRCKSHPNHRAGLEHAGIPAARAAQKEGE